MTMKQSTSGGTVIGSGMLAGAFSPVTKQEGVCVYAAGVSNSSCEREAEFSRERKRLTQALEQFQDAAPFVYFGTCSADDSAVKETPYVQHKLAMENLVKAHPRYLIIRLPQVAGETPNPHTLLNFLYARIARSERFTVWRNARRNIIDITDAVAIVRQFISDPSMRNITLNVANPASYAVLDIVRAMEAATGKPAIYDLVDRGSAYTIDVREAMQAADRAGVVFSRNYLRHVMDKYYGNLK